MSFGANITLPTGETPGPITLALSLNGEPLQNGEMTVVPAAVGALFNVSRIIEIDVPCNCCYTLSVRNIGTTPITVDGANLITIKEGGQ